MINAEIEMLKKQLLFKDFTEDELLKVYPLLKQKEFDINDIVLEEGDSTTELYLIKEGEVSVLKWDQSRKHQLPLAKLVPGQMFGEMSFVDGSLRSSSIKAIKHTSVWQLFRKDLNPLSPEMANIQSKLITNIAVINIQRLREANSGYVKNLRSGVSSLQRRVEKGQFILSLIALLALILIGGSLSVINWLPTFSLEMLHLSGWLVLYPLVMALIKSYEYYLDEFGVTTKNWKITLLSSISMSVVGIAFLFMSYWTYTHFNFPSFAIQHLSVLWIGIYLAYCYAYEFIARGVLQTGIQNFLNDEGGRRSVFLTASLVALFQMPLLHEYALLSFVANLILGSIYLWQQNILGVFIIHFILGVAIKFLVG